MALLTYVRPNQGAAPMLAVVAEDDGADYLFPDNVEPWLDDARIATLVEVRGSEPEDAAGWLELATYNLGLDVFIDEPVEIEDVGDAHARADQELANFIPYDGSSTELLDSAGEAFNNISQDYPDFAVEDGSPEAMLNYVLMALGPIDPDGPNGWLLRAQDGNPEPGDEDKYVHFPGMSSPVETKQTEAPE